MPTIHHKTLTYVKLLLLLLLLLLHQSHLCHKPNMDSAAQTSML
jgi:hypothetical protein